MNSFEEQRITIRHKNEDNKMHGTVRLTTGEGCGENCVRIEVNPPHDGNGLAHDFVHIPLTAMLRAVEALAKR